MVGEKIAQLKEVLKQSVVFAQFLSLLHITDRYLISPTLVYGPSMLPTLNFTGDILLIDKLTPFLGKLRPGDVVLVRSPQNPMKMITKRLIGLEGDSVSFLIDPASASNGSHSLVVPKGHVWIQGDNIYSSNDSRQMGPVPTALVLGKVFFRVWPPRDFGPLGGIS